jgi:transposase
MKLVETYLTCGSIAETARRWHTSRNLVRKRVRRFEEKGLSGFQDQSRRRIPPLPKPPGEIEAKVREARERTGYGRKRLSWYLWQEEGLVLSPNTIRHILRRCGYSGRRKRRKAFYPAQWAWEEERLRLSSRREGHLG